MRVRCHGEAPGSSVHGTVITARRSSLHESHRHFLRLRLRCRRSVRAQTTATATAQQARPWCYAVADSMQGNPVLWGAEQLG